MSATIRVEVTADDIGEGNAHLTWELPLKAALERLTGQDVDIDADGEDGHVATIGAGAWTLVIDLPDEANDWLTDRWMNAAALRGREPLSFDLEVPDWLVDLVLSHVSREELLVAARVALDVQRWSKRAEAVSAEAAS